MILVDDLVWYPYKNREWCHMVSDASLDELHEFASMLGMKRSWFQPHPLHPHYDLTKSKRELAVKLGAIEVNAKELSMRCVKLPIDF